MKVQTANRIIRYQEWAEQISACKQSGKTVRQWCSEQGINPKTYYNRMRVIREEMLELAEKAGAGYMSSSAGVLASHVHCGPKSCNNSKQEEQPVFVTLPMSQNSSATAPVTVRVGGYSVDIHNNADSDLLEHVLRLVVQL